jgi:hypothetical protein
MRAPAGPVVALRNTNRPHTVLAHPVPEHIISRFEGRHIRGGVVVWNGTSLFIQYQSGILAPFPYAAYGLGMYAPGFGMYGLGVYNGYGSAPVVVSPECSSCSGLRDGGSWAFKGRERGSDTSPSIHIDQYVEQMNIYQGTGPQNPLAATPPAPGPAPVTGPASPAPAPEKMKYVFTSRYNDCEPFTNNQLDDYGIEILENFLLAVDNSTNGRIKLVPKEPHGPRDKDWTLTLRDLNKGNAVVARIDIGKYAGKNGKPTDTPSKYIGSIIQELGKTGLISIETFSDVYSNFAVRYRNPCTVSGYAIAPTQGLVAAPPQGYALAPKTPATKKKPAGKRLAPK